MSKCNKIVPGKLYKNVRVVSTVGLLLSTWRLQLPTAKLLRAPVTIVYIRKLPGFLHHSFQTQKTPSTHLPNVCIPSRHQHSEDQLGPPWPKCQCGQKEITQQVSPSHSGFSSASYPRFVSFLLLFPQSLTTATAVATSQYSDPCDILVVAS